MAEFRVTPEALEHAGAQFSTSLAAFDEKVQVANRAVAGLIGGDWSGRAADGYGQGWAEVVEGIAEVRQALAGMAALLPQAAALYRTTDDSVARDAETGSSAFGPSTAGGE
ncbi:WXG100 family type VII secretion target [Frondihabitans australicus]|uniref:ESAT-6-like protein n=1 Tax=Frondihabitans australicus TaxID=386892 RepID=A0A495IMC0_9MICO|nr:WXG100 family type VII secretion target [Frondihabitans australicus]RKR76411.1 WXG100 family type VII secretion target [Frondihabitans australicus]